MYTVSIATHLSVIGGYGLVFVELMQHCQIVMQEQTVLWLMSITTAETQICLKSAEIMNRHHC